MSLYPTEEQLGQLEKWDFQKESVPDFLDEIKSLWHWPEWGFIRKGKKVIRLELHTGGWSGNEDIIDAIGKTYFWSLYWEKPVHGGHYYFKIKPLKTRRPQ